MTACGQVSFWSQQLECTACARRFAPAPELLGPSRLLAETVAEQIPDAPAQIHGDTTFTWRQFDQRANGVARHLLDAGAVEQDKVAQYLYNAPAYMESMFASFKAGLVPVNTNYRYADDELVYLWDNADAVAVVFHGSFAPNIERIRDRVPRVRIWLSAGARCASTPAAKWCSPRRSRRLSRPTPTCATPWRSGCPTRSSARPSPRWWSWRPPSSSTRRRSSPT
ncbi:hypothetical protein BH23ACT2_BH23ACT2_24830 [soil metagenome]